MNQETFSFVSNDTDISGVLFRPARYEAEENLAAVLVVGPWLNVKEQVATNYARRLAEKGFAAFAIDFRHWGKSGGEPREYERPIDKIADIHSALTYISERAGIDSERIGVLGVCFGVGYVAAAASNPLIKSIGTVAAWVHDVPSVTALIGEQETARRRAAGAKAKAAFETDGTIEYVPAGSASDKTAAMYSADPNFYYNTTARGVIPQWTNRYAVLGWEEWLDFDGVSQAENIVQPLVVVHIDGSALPDNAKRFFSHARGPKELVWMEGEHTQFYDTPPFIDHALDVVAAHFGSTLLSDRLRAQASRTAIAGTHEFLDALAASDIPRFLNVWADDGVQVMPYAPSGFPKRLEGKVAIEKQYEPLVLAYDGMSFPLETLRATSDPNVVVAEFSGSIKLKTGGRYDNRYVGVFAFNDDGLLAQYTEYFDPFVLLSSFPGARQMGPDGPQEVLRLLPQLTDDRDWERMETLFADEVDLDYTSLEGGAPKRLAPRELVALWRENLTRFDATKHNFSVPEVQLNGDLASATFTGQTTHVRKRDGIESRWTCGGDYESKFVRNASGWKLNYLRFTVSWQQGSP